MNRRLAILAGGISSRMKMPPQKELDSRLEREADKKAKTMIGLGDGDRPFLDYLLANACAAGYRDVVIVVNGRDHEIRDYYHRKAVQSPFAQLRITFAVQEIPHGRTKPLGTADAVLCALKERSDWKDQCFTVCNSDNLYSPRALSFLAGAGLWNGTVDYDRSSLDFPPSRIAAFAVLKKDEKGRLLDIIEKPTEAQIASVRDTNGRIGVSMNLFRFVYRDIFPALESVPVDPVRQEKELPAAVKMLLNRDPGTFVTIPISEHLPDLTSKEDIPVVKDYIKQGFSTSLDREGEREMSRQK